MFLFIFKIETFNGKGLISLYNLLRRSDEMSALWVLDASDD